MESIATPWQTIRRSKRPSKQLLWIWMDKIFQRSKEAKIGLDVACGQMSFRRQFLCEKYVGIDIDAERIRTGLERYPDAEGIVCSIEEIPFSLKGNFVVCLETVGINNYFDPNSTIICLNKLIDATLPGGELVVNVGPLSHKYSDEITRRLEEEFEIVQVRDYGAFSNPILYRYSLLIARLMQVFAPLRKSGGKPYSLYLCSYKIS